MAVNWNTVKQGISVDSISRVLSEGGIISGLDCTCLHNLKVFYMQEGLCKRTVFPLATGEK